ncbi:MAG: hypothetical protein R3C52_00995 [Hyphomonadaceae bacterium]
MRAVSIPVLAAFAALAACSPKDAAPAGETAPEAAAPDAAAQEDALVTPQSEETADCPVIESSDWTAWLDKMPGPGAQATLRVSGKVVLPTPGFTLSLTAGMADRSAIPVQTLNLSATPPQEQVIQVLTTETVEFSAPAIAEAYRGVRIRCGDQMLAEITEVETAH